MFGHSGALQSCFAIKGFAERFAIDALQNCSFGKFFFKKRAWKSSAFAEVESGHLRAERVSPLGALRRTSLQCQESHPQLFVTTASNCISTLMSRSQRMSWARAHQTTFFMPVTLLICSATAKKNPHSVHLGCPCNQGQLGCLQSHPLNAQLILTACLVCKLLDVVRHGVVGAHFSAKGGATQKESPSKSGPSWQRDGLEEGMQVEGPRELDHIKSALPGAADGT